MSFGNSLAGNILGSAFSAQHMPKKDGGPKLSDSPPWAAKAAENKDSLLGRQDGLHGHHGHHGHHGVKQDISGPGLSITG